MLYICVCTIHALPACLQPKRAVSCVRAGAVAPGCSCTYTHQIRFATLLPASFSCTCRACLLMQAPLTSGQEAATSACCYTPCCCCGCCSCTERCRSCPCRCSCVGWHCQLMVCAHLQHSDRVLCFQRCLSNGLRQQVAVRRQRLRRPCSTQQREINTLTLPATSTSCTCNCLLLSCSLYNRGARWLLLAAPTTCSMHACYGCCSTAGTQMLLMRLGARGAGALHGSK